jgi:ABC-type Zn uptake system ZnuABC Zn-binding protein ZnuA
MKEQQVRALIVEPWGDPKPAGRIAEEAGARAVVLAPGVGSVAGAETYPDMVEYNVTALARALR